MSVRVETSECDSGQEVSVRVETSECDSGQEVNVKVDRKGVSLEGNELQTVKVSVPFLPFE